MKAAASPATSAVTNAHQQVLDLEHYLDVLERKPGALIGSKPLAAWRQRGLWPESYDRLLAELIAGTASRAAPAR